MRHRAAFTLIELLVVVAIIALLLSVLLPALGQVRHRTKKVQCQTNLRTIGHTMQFYLSENRDTYPDAPFYGCLGYQGRSQHHALMGSQDPESTRPMNKYFLVEDNAFGDEFQVERKHKDLFECPSDKGDAYFKLTGKYFVEHGTSYTYASEIEAFPVPTFGVMSCRGVRASQFKYPAKKIVFQEPVFNPSFDLNDHRSRWHEAGRHHGNLLFADSHVNFAYTQIFDVQAQPDEHEVYY